MRQDSIEWEEKTGYLIDSVALGVGAEGSGVYPVGTAKPFRLAEHVTHAELIKRPKKKPKKKFPFFRYYKYAPTSALGTTEAAATLTRNPAQWRAKKLETKAPAGERSRRGAGQLPRRAPTPKKSKLGSASEATYPQRPDHVDDFRLQRPQLGIEQSCGAMRMSLPTLAPACSEPRRASR